MPHRRHHVPGVLFLLSLLLVPSPCHAGVEENLARSLQNALSHNGAVAYLIACAAGVFTSLTPCVYPLIPITVGLFGARDDEVTRLRALFLATCYVGGIAVMYTALGVFVALTGKAFGAFLANPYVIVPIAVFFLLMAASMFGAFELSLPVEWQGRLAGVGGKGPRGAFLMGLVAGVIAAPCTGPPLLVLLTFVATQKSVLLGGSLLFVYALGMGLLFWAIAGFALKLPRSGAWMEGIKSAFGVVMILAALYYLRNVVAPLRDYGRDSGSFVLLHVAVAVVGVLLGAIHLSFHDGTLMVLRKAVGVLVLCVGLFGVLSWFLAPRILWLRDEAQAVARARQEHRPLLVDFAAEWCLPCKEMERKTFADPLVKPELARFVLLRVDCTNDEDPKGKELQTRYDAAALPTVVLYDGGGKEVLRLREFTAARDLLPALQRTR